jgi:Phage integrase family
MLIASGAQLDELDGRGLYDPERNLELFAQVPAPLRLAHYTPRSVPAHPAFRWRTEHPKWLDLDLRTLPEPMQRELAYAFWRLVEQGLGLNANYRQLIWRLDQMLDDRRTAARAVPESLIALSLREWEREWRLSRARRNGRLAVGINQWSAMRRCYQHLALAYDPREWWQHDLWSPKLDSRIPLREHEPTRMNAGYDFLALAQPWLREALKWHCKVKLDTGGLRWGTVRSRLHSLTLFSRFLGARGVDEPRLAATPAELRVLALDFLGELSQRRIERGANQGRAMATGTITTVLGDVEQFYAFMADHRHEAAQRLAEPRWSRLGDEHARLWRSGEKPAKRRGPVPDRAFFDDVTMGQVMQHAGLLGAPVAEGGFGDEQAMRLLMLLVRTGRRVSELRLLDFDCLLPLQHLADTDGQDGALVAKLHYQQTKIDGAPDTIFVDAEVVEIIRAQQQWAHAWLRRTLRDEQGRPPRYLFLSTQYNGRGMHPYPKTSLGQRLREFGRRTDIRDGQSRPVNLGHVHRFRHTRATSLLNAGVPVHVLQRYLGHVSPRMTMHYAQTVRETHEREFLRFRKITADARELQIDPRDLFDVLELDKRTDRVLPNGLCMLPPRQACQRGNACLTCGKFATDASYLREHEQQLSKLDALIEQRKAIFRAKTGQEMADSNVWLEQRLTERRALQKIVAALRTAAARKRRRRARRRRCRAPAARKDAAQGANATARTRAAQTRSRAEGHERAWLLRVAWVGSGRGLFATARGWARTAAARKRRRRARRGSAAPARSARRAARPARAAPPARRRSGASPPTRYAPHRS